MGEAERAPRLGIAGGRGCRYRSLAATKKAPAIGGSTSQSHAERRGCYPLERRVRCPLTRTRDG
jgi:hypothetical protein